MASAAKAALRALRPLGDRVLVRRLEAVTKTAGGIVLPDSAVTRVNQGEVVSVGPGARNRDGDIVPVPLNTGDVVLLPEYGGHKVTLEGEDTELALFRQDDILGVFEE